MKMTARTEPEIRTTRLDSVVLQLKTLGVKSILGFQFIDTPPVESVMRAMETLYHLGAIDSDGNLTDLGKIMSALPLDPTISKMVIASSRFNCSEEVISIASLLSVQSTCFLRPPALKDLSDDTSRR